MQIFQMNGFGLKARSFDLLGYSFKHTTSYLISFPLTMGEGWDGGGHRGSSPPTLILPLRGGRKLFFLTQLGSYFRLAAPRREAGRCQAAAKGRKAQATCPSSEGQMV